MADVSEASEIDVDKAVAAAKIAFESWRSTSVSYRAGLLKKLAELIRRDGNDLANLEAISMGRPINEYLHFEVPFSAQSLDGTAAIADLIRGETSVQTPGYLNMSLYQPVC